MAKIEDQRILIWCNREKELQGVILDAVYIALKFEKEICLFGNYHSEKEKKVLNDRSQLYANIIKRDMPNLDVSTLLLKGKLKDLIHKLGEDYNAILFCCSGKINQQLLVAFYRTGFPFYFWKATELKEIRFKNIQIPIDFRNSTKDATLWGSYFGRFNNSEIELRVANDIDLNLQQKVEQLVEFVRNFYGQFFFRYNIKSGSSNSWKIHKEALQ